MIYDKESLVITKTGVTFTTLMVKVDWKKAIVLLAATNLLPRKIEPEEGTYRKVVEMDMSSDVKAAFLYNRPGQEVLKLRVNYVFGHPEWTTCRVYRVGKYHKAPVESWDKGFPMYFDKETDEPYAIYIKKELGKRFKEWGIKAVFKESELLINPLAGKQKAINKPKPKVAVKRVCKTIESLQTNIGEMLSGLGVHDNTTENNDNEQKTENTDTADASPEIHVNLESKINAALEKEQKE